MKFRLLSLAVLALSAAAYAANLTGTVTNRTTGKPAAGDDVVLLRLVGGMDEVGRTKTDARGRFSFDQDTQAPHLIRVNHQNVNYFPKGGPAAPGTTSVEIDVYDVAPKVEGVAMTVNVMRIEADSSAMRIAELYAVKNSSNPPRTQMSDRAFEIVLPEGAQVEASYAAGSGGQPVTSAPVPTGEKNRYALVFPLRPGETRFQVSYSLPYSGEATIQPKLLYPADHLVVMLAKPMQFSPLEGAAFQSMGEEQGAEVRVATGVRAGQPLAFRVSGTGSIDARQQVAGEAPGDNRGRPGGGLGAPIQSPDPLQQYRWYILGGLGAAMALGAFYVVTRREPATIPFAAASGKLPIETYGRSVAPAEISDRLLEALKEELFQLELDRHQGRLSSEEYEKAKAALDLTIARAAARKGNS
ncbi:MAG TPA: carboxypeptidase-like regulatory domain-containing protein [Terriglobales bacterium]|nr:carboxypeptidase-like regulatory domain-containing protein [Terriglobales bacterium]